ncbi:TetR/AcrR family transcriptional regulator [Phenylobacterium immobile]|uniref:TetR/AcrR family transcriptional regulator n=1 Tax=Phenylobacterium immobile TaxID=21 RepID=UPI000AD1340F|nr:TetR/AcrR family transcriptional regulator [Phenylobacterium immobile]
MPDSLTSAEGAAAIRPALNRARIVEAAIVLMLDEGSSALSMRRLGQQLSVRAMAMYKHFEDRDDLVNAVLERLYEEIGEMRPGQDAFEGLRDYMLSIHRVIEAFPFLREFLGAKAKLPQVWEDRRFRQIGALVATGAPHIDSKLGFSILFRMMLGSLSPNPHEAKDRENELVVFGIDAVIDLLRKRASA